MWVVEVVPLARGLHTAESLTYFTTLEVAPGDIVRVPLRKRTVYALVNEVRPLAEAKAELRHAPYTLRRLTAKTSQRWLPEPFLSALREEARFLAAPLGVVLRLALAQPLLELAPAIATHLTASPSPAPSSPLHGADQVLLLQEHADPRLQEYHTLVREVFASHQSVTLLCPTIEEAERVFAALTRHTPTHTFLLHSSQPKRRLRDTLLRVLQEPHPVAVVATPSFLPIPRADIGLLIIEGESSPAYIAPARPHLHFARLAERYGLFAGWRVIRADVPLSVESYHRWLTHNVGSLRTITARISFPAPAEVVSLRRNPTDATPQPKTALQKERTVLLSPRLEEELRRLTTSGGRAVLFAARRGLAPLTVCDDCGASIQCGACGATLVTHREGTRSFFLCHACGAIRPATEACSSCGSWRLSSLGVATARVARLLSALFPETMVAVIDSDHTPNRDDAYRVLERFYETSPAILVGTQKLLPLLQKPVHLSAIVSFDTILSLPSWNAEERALRIGLALRERTKRVTIVQTRLPTDTPLFQALADGFLRPWYRHTLELRERLGYPPFAVLVRLTLTGSRQRIQQTAASLEPHLPSAYFTGRSRLFPLRGSRALQHFYLRVPSNEWPNETLAQFLATLPPSVTVEVNPSSILA